MRNRCGALLPEDTQARIKHKTCRKFVAIPGSRCHLHRRHLVFEPAPDAGRAPMYGGRDEDGL